MKKFLLAFVLLVMTAPLFAQSGVFMDAERIGEGITVFEHVTLDKEVHATFYFYTYDNYDNQRWLLGSDEWDMEEGQSQGFLYQTYGVNYPDGVPSSEPFEPDAVTVGKTFPVGVYTLRKAKLGGYKMWVEPPIDPKDRRPEFDYLYNRTWWFTFPLIELK